MLRILIQLTPTLRIVSNNDGDGYEMQEASIDKATGAIKTRKESGKEVWKFKWQMNDLPLMLKHYIEECTPVADEALTGTQAIIDTIEREFQKLRETLMST